MNTEISSSHTRFLKKWLSIILVLVSILIPILLDEDRYRGGFPTKVFITIFTLGFSVVCMNTMLRIKRVYINDNEIKFEGFKEVQTIDFKSVYKAWQSFGFFTRLVNVDYIDKNGKESTFFFIPKFEVDLNSNQHPIVSTLNEKIKTAANNK
ncbi:MAG: hypothetical protein CMD35_04705 [Flavobacteriales bacterium]|nr:hypothetical protein [Flavobacteriales bacterium]|tara:strand:- start:881 stop:1336 length:456 start_codon:yes stop_codon:yes gene_type:complete